MRRSKEAITETLYNEKKEHQSLRARAKTTALRLGGTVLACTLLMTCAFTCIPAFRETVEKNILTATLAGILSSSRKQETEQTAPVERQATYQGTAMHSEFLPGIGTVWYAGSGARTDELHDPTEGEIPAQEIPTFDPNGGYGRVTLGRTLADLLACPEPGKDDRFAVSWRIFGYDSDDVYNAFQDDYGKCISDYNAEMEVIWQQLDTYSKLLSEKNVWSNVIREWENAARLETYEGKTFAAWFEDIKELPEEEQEAILGAWTDLRDTFVWNGYTIAELTEKESEEHLEVQALRNEMDQLKHTISELSENRRRLDQRIGDTFFSRFCEANSITPTEDELLRSVLYLTKAQIEGLRGVDGVYLWIDAVNVSEPLYDIVEENEGVGVSGGQR